MSKEVRRFLMLLALLLGASWQATAQSTAGSVAGEVLDERQAAIPNATVTVRNVLTNESRTAQTDDEGRYRVVNLPVGD